MIAGPLLLLYHSFQVRGYARDAVIVNLSSSRLLVTHHPFKSVSNATS